MYCLFYVVLCIVCVCICVLNYCHRMATQLQLNISYHIIHTHPYITFIDRSISGGIEINQTFFFSDHSVFFKACYISTVHLLWNWRIQWLLSSARMPEGILTKHNVLYTMNSENRSLLFPHMICSIREIWTECINNQTLAFHTQFCSHWGLTV
jgi:hypothetical protein